MDLTLLDEVERSLDPAEWAGGEGVTPTCEVMKSDGQTNPLSPLLGRVGETPLHL